ncbi:MAG: hypothetical protein HYT83_04015 [Candidatus Levybacteria bacterium]|nr:hypothetical protein [Candidatus Levybacteria bacterium]
MNSSPLSQCADIVVSVFEKEESAVDDKKITVNPVVSKVATWYEKLRNAMDYREEEVILRAAIERILKRRILLGGIGKTIAGALVRELVWAKYFPNESLSESLVAFVEKRIDLYLKLREYLLLKQILSDRVINEWIIDLMSSDIENVLHPGKEKEVMSNFMYKIMRENITIADDTEQTRDAQVFIAVRRSFAKDDRAFLRYQLFCQFFNELTEENVKEVSGSFKKAYDEIEAQLNYIRKDTINSYVKSKTAVFFVLEGVLQTVPENIRALLQDEEEFRTVVFKICEQRYNGISSKVRRAIVRSVFFILLTKVIFAFAIEGTFERLVYGNIIWRSIILNTSAPPLLMIIVGFFIKAPGKSNSEKIFHYINKVLFEEHPKIGSPLLTYKNPKQLNPVLNFIFSLLWFLAFIVSFGAIVYVLTKLHFTIVSQGVFLFFIAIVSFLSYRIALVPRTYTVGDKDGLVTPIIDFFFMPIIKVGRSLTEGISQINILIFLFDFVIEAPFKGIFAFFEQWFRFLHAKREELG